MGNRPKTVPIDVCAAVIRRGDAFLLAQRPSGSHLAGMWEFPGGKIHPGESLRACIEREILEELAVIVAAGNCIDTISHAYPSKTIRLHFMACELEMQAPERGNEDQLVGWFTPEEMATIAIAPADRAFIKRQQGHSSGPDRH
ncbi:MAG: (deoxy)nucleoside triphosphate pyrophosphohydrolase [Lentisphaerae bacterium]|jgi:mutator protein MutT|nr:(deoxy)nucleoside triphosphate pyrophosphohydrolase [Lentisphaerota bacterium]MBT4821474.1 (deoxy)nucleoside triphosphate pyrophosphohydrolase [Lentisphaerota bacterium]MBT5608903.1 (deoxy)nucleoside triphosphate pyrophosphohydrolase [Lentisphaerota bacterium]MBT7057385.1 (deoxy)nucleoside triphosphate pyrophosphohydrolase [Lentisphaerota bacterium]MBT7842769.1 (deoxy)nucleoside triphosphate pyrophosphohydrolase [Lentisphaerota bacterium]